MAKWTIPDTLTPGNPTGELKRRMDEHRRERDARIRAEGMKEMLEIYTRAETSGGCGETAMRMAILALTQKDRTNA